jgi:hypothetical protein
VQRAVGITPDQLGRLGQTDVQLRLGLQNALRNLGRVTDGQRAVRSDEFLLRYNSDLMRAVAGILGPQQMALYRQLSKAQEGLNVFTDPDVVKRLDLTDSQRERLRKLRDQTDGQMQDVIKKAGSDVAAAQQKAAEVRLDSMKQASRILDDTQRRQFAQVTGLSLDFTAKAVQPAAATRTDGH